MERRNSIQDQERHNIARNTTATVCNKDTAKERATEGHTTSWRRLLVQVNPLLEESTCSASDSVLHTRADTRRARHQETKVQPVGERHNTTTQPAKTSDKPWTGWTNFEEHEEFPTQLEPDDEEQQQGTKARAVQAPKQPTPQEILEHNVTQLPYTGVGGQYAYKREADRTIAQSSTASFQSYSLTSATSKALMTVTYIRPHAVLQSDQKKILTARMAAAANKNGNITTRNSGAYSSQSQGGVERAHRTFFSQSRTLKAQTRQNYNRDVSMKHQLMPWIVQHSAYIMNRYAVHSNGCTSHFNRWNRDHFASLLGQQQ